MKSVVMRFALGAILAGGVSVSAVLAAEEGAAKESTRVLPTLLIKGEVVSLDSNDPNATLLKVKDRYGFETPIYLTPETKITQGDTTQTVSSLTPGTSAEVEYNFDVNTAKRHAVSVKLTVPTSSAQAPMGATSTPPAPAAAAQPTPAAPQAPATSAPAQPSGTTAQ